VVCKTAKANAKNTNVVCTEAGANAKDVNGKCVEADDAVRRRRAHGVEGRALTPSGGP
jgi:hypothetical protein